MESRKDDKSVPKEFHENNRSKKDRVEHLAELAKKKFLEELGSINEFLFLELTKTVDPKGKGIAKSTLYRNKTVHEIFISLINGQTKKGKNPKNKKPSKSKRSQAKILRNKYSGKSKLTLIEMLEKMILTTEELKKHISEYQKEISILKQQNENQLVLLTKLKEEGKY